jgi:hypothetical protein
MSICKEKLDMLPPLDAIGLKPSDQSFPMPVVVLVAIDKALALSLLPASPPLDYPPSRQTSVDFSQTGVPEATPQCKQLILQPCWLWLAGYISVSIPTPIPQSNVVLQLLAIEVQLPTPFELPKRETSSQKRVDYFCKHHQLELTSTKIPKSTSRCLT